MTAIPPLPTLADMVTSCLHNADVANFQRRRIRQQLRGLEPGEEREHLLLDLSKYEADFHHWSDYVGYYRARAAKEGQGTFPRMVRQKLALVAAEPDPPREPGEDDDDEQRP